MADVHKAITFVLKLEDDAMTGVITNRREDHGGRTRWGLAEHWHPELTHVGYYDTMSREASLEWAMIVYESSYAKPLHIFEIDDQRVANSVLSLGVVSGIHVAALMLQDSLTAIGSKVGLDGSIGPATIEAANRVKPAELLEEYIAQQKTRFRLICSRDPTQKIDLAGWCSRADKARVVWIA